MKLSGMRPDEIILTLNQFTQQNIIPFETLTGANVKVEHIMLPWLDGLEARMIAYLAEHVVIDKTVTFPSTWWDALKDRFLPTCLKRFIGVSYTTIEVKVAELASKWRVPENMGPWPYMIWRESKASIFAEEGA